MKNVLFTECSSWAFSWNLSSQLNLPFQSMFLEDGGKVHEEKEWYYGNKEKERFGPYSVREVGGVQCTFYSVQHTVYNIRLAMYIFLL